MDEIETLERLHERHFNALETVGGNQGIKAYALESRADVMCLIKRQIKLLKALREIEEQSRFWEATDKPEGRWRCFRCIEIAPNHHRDCIFFELDTD